MPVTHESVTIDRSRADVWDFLIEPSNQTVWQTSLVEYDTAREGEPEVGDQERGVTKVAGRRIEWTSEVTRIDSGKVLAIKSVSAPFPFTWSMELDDEDGGTRVTVHAETESLGGFFGKLADPIVQNMYSRDVRASLENLKQVLEQS